MAKPKTVKEAMEDQSYKVRNISYKHSDRLRIDFEPRFAHSGKKICSFWISSTYFKRTYPRVYDRFY